MKKLWTRLEGASQDPAVTFLVLLPLALIHLAGRKDAGSAAYSLVEKSLRVLGEGAPWTLAAIMALAGLWALGRIRALSVPWRAGALFAAFEGMIWGFALHPALAWLTSVLGNGGGLGWETEGGLRGGFSLAAGAGLYEELLFRALLLGWTFTLAKTVLRGLGWGESASGPAWALGLLVSAGCFSLAHGWGDPSQLDSSILLFRFLAGVLLGVLYSWRGLAVVAYAHAFYNALILI